MLQPLGLLQLECQPTSGPAGVLQPDCVRHKEQLKRQCSAPRSGSQQMNDATLETQTKLQNEGVLAPPWLQLIC